MYYAILNFFITFIGKWIWVIKDERVIKNKTWIDFLVRWEGSDGGVKKLSKSEISNLLQFPSLKIFLEI